MFDLGFGDPVLIRSCLKNMQALQFANMGYRLEDDCENEIIAWVRSYYKNMFHKEYKHIMLTHGANGGLHMAVKTLKKSKDYFYINDLSFAWYKKILQTEKVTTVLSKDLRQEMSEMSSVYIVDSPSNPWGHQILNDDLNSSTVVWDSVYASPIFMDAPILAAPKHTVMVGSLSKMLGLSGLRIGWIATNDDFLAENLSFYISTCYCGLSTPSLEMANQIIQDIDLRHFNFQAKLHLDFNREEFQKLKNIFSLDAPPFGMFYMGVLDDLNRKILEKANVKGIELRAMDGSEYIRFNMADDYQKTKEAIKLILKHG